MPDKYSAGDILRDTAGEEELFSQQQEVRELVVRVRMALRAENYESIGYGTASCPVNSS